MATRVNLDALIRREDFDETVADSRPPGTRKDKLGVNDLVYDSFFFGALRKPDFQRETSEWDPQKILGLIESFVNGDLIPAIILWQSKSNLTFVIDGSHRLSAIAAWINDDYGAGKISQALYEGIIPEEQVEIDTTVRDLIRKRIGSYSDHQLAVKHPDKVKPDIVDRSKALGTISIQLQWVEGDSRSAELSFRKINEQGVPINTTEKKILEARRKPIGFTSRAIIRSGKGYNYWKDFKPEVQSELKGLASEVNILLFCPKFKTPIKTLDLPLAGKLFSAQALPIVWEFIRIVNPMDKVNADDIEGTLTVAFLNNCRKIAQRINSSHQSSLGLHPIIYFYTENGRHKPASFYAVTDLMLEFEKTDQFIPFIRVRRNFEELLAENDYIIQQIVRKFRSATASYQAIKQFYMVCIEKLGEEKSIAKVIDEVFHSKDFSFLTKPNIELPQNPDRDFSQAVKSRTFIKAALEGLPRCAICGGFVHTSSVSIDHGTDKKDGGDASFQNAQVTHPYCNSAKDRILKALPHLA
ncbi:MAG: DUF262 domain-containing protein [Verrucomicrobiota bacterium]|jgi:hypothetical protein